MKKAELEARVAELEKILADHFTQVCDRCRRVGLCEPEATWDSFEWACLDDKPGCEERYRERLRLQREARAQRRDGGDLAEAMKDFYNRTLLEQARADVLFSHLTAAHKEPEPDTNS